MDKLSIIDEAYDTDIYVTSSLMDEDNYDVRLDSLYVETEKTQNKFLHLMQVTMHEVMHDPR